MRILKRKESFEGDFEEHERKKKKKLEECISVLLNKI